MKNFVVLVAIEVSAMDADEAEDLVMTGSDTWDYIEVKEIKEIG